MRNDQPKIQEYMDELHARITEANLNYEQVIDEVLVAEEQLDSVVGGVRSVYYEVGKLRRLFEHDSTQWELLDRILELFEDCQLGTYVLEED